ncbi:hypothetical protein CE91St41_02170 [Oscillospiraceae bacterium]|nr:hypothetical protein CE91St40_02170 [Oscillospiraceae bacterium]BDF73328.1 hypothetical protein CE91St41_02170 [Oscillospiraceae bacterium]
MKKRISAIALVLAMIFSISASAAVLRWDSGATIAPDVTFSGIKATCVLDITTGDDNATVTGSMTLSKGGTTICTWSGLSGSGDPTFSKSCTNTQIVPGTYTLSYNLTIKSSLGTDRISDSATFVYR